MIDTDDLFLAALVLVRGGELLAVSVRGTNGRRLAVFSIDGAEAEAVAREYHRGETSVDLRLLKSEVRRLKDLAFGALRGERPPAELAYRPSGTGSRADGRTATRSAEDAAVGASGAARPQEERRGPHAGHEGRDRSRQVGERAFRGRR